MCTLSQLVFIGIVFCILVQQIHGDLKIVADCGKPADVGDSVLLTCSVYGTLSHGITWKRGGDSVATCYQDRKCTSEDKAKYRVSNDQHPHTMQQVTIISTTQSDFVASFTCCDGMTCNDNSTCRLQRKTWAITEADCGDRAVLGQSAVLRCMVRSKIHNGIRWFRNGILIVQCNEQKFCISSDDRFHVYKKHDDKNQQIIIKTVTTEDLRSQFTCVDNSLIPPSSPPDSTCRLRQYHETSTRVYCGPAVTLGDTAEMSCTALGSLAYGINWFRDGNGIIRCSQSYECYSSDKSRYTYYKEGNTVRLSIRNIAKDDLDKTFSCQDSPELPSVISDESKCKLVAKVDHETSTKVNCGPAVTLGDTADMSCTALGNLAYGINWFRDGNIIIRCSKSYECHSSDKSRYEYHKEGNTVRLSIRNIAKDDLDKTFSCQDSPELPSVISDESKCKLNVVSPLTNAAEKTYHLSGILMVVAVVTLQLRR